jgi:hypothetical protein
MPRKGVLSGYQEMGPHQTARDLLGHLQKGDKLAIVSRFGQTSHEDQLIEALEARGIQVRFVSKQTGVQDFCFLLNAKKELIGMGVSTYFFWAGILGNASNVRSYFMESPQTLALVGGDYRVDYQWKTRELRDRFKFELYKVDGTIGRLR